MGIIKKFKPKFDAVIVKPIENKESVIGNIIVPNSSGDVGFVGEVVGVGNGRISANGETIPPQTFVGEIVVLPSMGFTKFKLNNQTYYIGKENELLTEIIEENE